MRALRDAGKHRKQREIRLARVGLAADSVGGVEAELRDYAFFKLLHLFGVAVEKLEEARGGAGRALAAEQLHIREREIDLFKIHKQILEPERCALAHRRRLRGLEMRIRERRYALVFLREVRNGAYRREQFALDKQHRAALYDHVRVVADVAGGRAEVDYPLRGRARFAVGVDVRHDVVTHFLFLRGGEVVIDIVDMRLHFRDLRVGNIQPELLFALRESDPELAPGGELLVIREDALHFVPRVSLAERAFVVFVHIHFPFHRR